MGNAVVEILQFKHAYLFKIYRRKRVYEAIRGRSLVVSQLRAQNSVNDDLSPAEYDNAQVKVSSMR